MLIGVFQNHSDWWRTIAVAMPSRHTRIVVIRKLRDRITTRCTSFISINQSIRISIHSQSPFLFDNNSASTPFTPVPRTTTPRNIPIRTPTASLFLVPLAVTTAVPTSRMGLARNPSAGYVSIDTRGTAAAVSTCIGGG